MGESQQVELILGEMLCLSMPGLDKGLLAPAAYLMANAEKSSQAASCLTTVCSNFKLM